MKKFTNLARWVGLPFVLRVAFIVLVGSLNWLLSPILPEWLMSGVVMSGASFVLVYFTSVVVPVDSVKVSNLVFPVVGAVLGFFAAFVSFLAADFIGIILYPVAILVAGDLARRLVARSVRLPGDTSDDPPLGRFLK